MIVNIKTKYIVLLLSFLACAQSNAMLQRLAALIVPATISGAITYKAIKNRSAENKYNGYNVRFPALSNRLVIEPNNKLTSLPIKPHERHVHLLLEEHKDDSSYYLNRYLGLKKTNILVSPQIWNDYCNYRKKKESIIKERYNTPNTNNPWDLYHKKDNLLYLNPDTHIDTKHLAKKVVSCRKKIIANDIFIQATDLRDWDIQKTPSGLLFLAHKDTPGAKYFNTTGWQKQTEIAPIAKKPFCLNSFKKLFPEKDPKTNWYFCLSGHGNKETFWTKLFGLSIISGMGKHTTKGILSFIGNNLNTKQVVITSCYVYPQKIFDLMGTKTLPYDLITSNDKNESIFTVTIRTNLTPYNYSIGIASSIEALGKKSEKKIAILTTIYKTLHEEDEQTKKYVEANMLGKSAIRPVLVKAGNEKPEDIIDQ